MNDFTAMKLILESNHVEVDGPKSDLKDFEYWIENNEEGSKIYTKYVVFVFVHSRLEQMLGVSMSFKEWKEEVNKIVIREVGLSCDDLPDVPYHDWYTDKVSIKIAAKRVIKNAKEN